MTPRLRAALIALVLVPIGLATKRSSVSWVAESGGGVLYVAFFCFVWFACQPSARRSLVIPVVTLATCAIEFLQLWKAPWLESLRATRAGGLFLGSSFAWADMPYYFAGGALAWVLSKPRVS